LRTRTGQLRYRRVSPLLEVWIVVEREVRKNLRSVKGVVMFSLSILGAMACTFRIPKIEETLATAQQFGAEQLHDAKAKLFADIYGSDSAGERLADAPVKLVALFWLAVWLTPLLVAILGFDGVPSDVQYRSVRYWTIRMRRGSYYVGKFLGLWLVIATITLVMHALIWAVTIARADATASETLAWGVRFYLISLPISGAWCGIATLIASLLRTPILALLLTCATFFTLFFAGVIVGRNIHNEVLQAIYPNSYDAWMLSTSPTHALGGLAITLAFAAVSTAAGAFVFSQRDV
jgi:ABC-type transport system involved in multi-copper enzyme maturation permease subunit